MKNFSKKVCYLLTALFLGHEGSEAMLGEKMNVMPKGEKSIGEMIKDRMEKNGTTVRKIDGPFEETIQKQKKTETNTYSAIQVESIFGVANGLSGMKRDVILNLLTNPIFIGYGKEHEYPVRIVIGMCAEHYAWIKHMYFVEYRSLSTQPCRPSKENYNLLGDKIYREFTLGFPEQEIYEQREKWDLYVTLTEFVNYFEGKELSPLEKAVRNRALSHLKENTIVPEFQALVKDRPNSFLFEINTFGLFLSLVEYPDRLKGILLSMTLSMLRSLPVRFIVGLSEENIRMLEAINEDLGGTALTKPQLWTIAGIRSLETAPELEEREESFILSALYGKSGDGSNQ